MSRFPHHQQQRGIQQKMYCRRRRRRRRPWTCRTPGSSSWFFFLLYNHYLIYCETDLQSRFNYNITMFLEIEYANRARCVRHFPCKMRKHRRAVRKHTYLPTMRWESFALLWNSCCVSKQIKELNGIIKTKLICSSFYARKIN